MTRPPCVHEAVSRDNDQTTGRAKGGRESGPDLLRGFLLVVMAVDHLVFSLGTGEHDTGDHTEYDSQPVQAWNHPLLYIVRMATHLCASGFTFLLGMGVVYLGRSRSRIGWSNRQLLWHVAIRALILTAISIAWGLFITLGEVWLFNLILFSLAVDYLLVGLMWIVINDLEERLGAWIDKVWYSRLRGTGDGDTTPLLLARRPGLEGMERDTKRSKSIAGLIFNALLLILSVVTIWWNIWLSETHGHCSSADSSPVFLSTEASRLNVFLRVWFWVVEEKRVHSMFPPMAWLSFAILGLLYGRIRIVQKRRSPYVTSLGIAAAAVPFYLLFVCTRLFRFGNLSEDCLRTRDQAVSPEANQYLASVASFFYIVKYNPDVAHWAFTMAVNLSLLAAFTAIPTSVASRLTALHDFGTAPLFFFQVHQLIRFPFIEVTLYLLGYHKSPGDPIGYDYLWGTLIWFFSMIFMWPLCRWYGLFKATKPSDSIWRFF